MTAFLVVGAAALAVSALTLFSGFGLGTLLLPAFALFFPIPLAVAATAVVHALNNLFKLALLGRQVDGRLVARFGVPAAVAAFPGAWLLTVLPSDPWLVWGWGARGFEATPVGVVMGVLILGFAALELAPSLDRLRPAPRWLAVGGLLSGFFGGLSGHQGALRAAFLGSLGLAPARFAATRAAIATLVDAARLLVYGSALLGAHASPIATGGEWPLVALATGCAFTGAWLGARMLPRVTVALVRRLTGVLLLAVGLGIATGVV